jgi:RNA polymerase sigma-70 factor (ECF subfamily)
MRDDSWKLRADAAMERYADGDDVAFGELYDLLRPRLLAFASRRIRDASEAEELVHETFLRMHVNRQHFAHGTKVMPWAFAIARNLLIDRYRKMRDPLEPPADEPERPDAIVSRQRLGRRVAEELARLPEAHREAFALVNYDGLSITEAAQVLGTTAMAVKMRTHRTYEALRKKLGDLAREELKAT